MSRRHNKKSVLLEASIDTLYNLAPLVAILCQLKPWNARMILSKKLVDESFPTPYFKASSMKLPAIVLHGNGLEPFPILMQENVQRNPGTIKGSESGDPSGPFKNLSTNHDIPS